MKKKMNDVVNMDEIVFGNGKNRAVQVWVKCEDQYERRFAMFQ